MPDTGKDFGADLYRLYTVAKDYLPTAADFYDRAQGLVSMSSPLVANAMRARPGFTAPDFCPADLPHRVHESWTSLSDETHTILKDTWSSLTDTASSLEQATDEYARTDEEAAAEFDRLRHRHEPVPTD